jgi:segregation and condensation protein A
MVRAYYFVDTCLRIAMLHSPAMMTSEEQESHAPPVELKVFSGPLDLLLHLIRKNEVSIYDIPIVSICDQYHEHLRAMQELDLDIAGEFLWMASWLLHLKSKTLLPTTAEGEEDPREELVERLLAYRGVKELASHLHDCDIVRRCLWMPDVAARAGSLTEQEIDWEDVDLRLLAQTYLEVMQRFEASHPPPLEVLPLRYKVEEKMSDIYYRVRSEGLVPLLRDLNSRSDREEVVTVVVAALELVRLRGVFAEQRKAFAEIYLRPGDRQLSKQQLLRHGENSE